MQLSNKLKSIKHYQHYNSSQNVVKYSGCDAKNTAVIATPIGKLGIEVAENIVCKINFLPKNSVIKASRDKYLNSVIEQLNHYFADPRYIFCLEMDLIGTDFQKRVWQALRQIPTGKTLTYGELAKLLKSHPRAIGQACRTNPVPIIIPCHRVVAQQDHGGFAGAKTGSLIDIKKWLLQHELTQS